MGKRNRETKEDENHTQPSRFHRSASSDLDSSTDEESAAPIRALAGSHDRVRAHKGASDDEYYSDDSESISEAQQPSSDVEEDESKSEEQGDIVESDPSASGAASDDGSQEDTILQERSSISFGALAKAQSQLTQNERSNHDRSTNIASRNHDFEAEALERKAGKKDDRDFNRQSKHAPAEVSSKKAVSRKRSVVPIHKINVRDPRFDLTPGKVNTNQIKKNYAFLAEYRDTEIKELKAGIRKTKDPKAKATMELALKSMESRKRTEQLNEQRQEVLREFRKEEGQKVKGGKKPFFLKKSEIKKRALEERLKAMKSRDRTKTIERRRKKETAKERKEMPLARRM